MPAKADPKAQKSFLENTLKPLIEKAKNLEIELFFMDASHFVMGGFAGRVWSIVRRYIKTASGRQRYNVLGALNFVSKKITTICNDTYITSVQVVEMLHKLSAACTIPIHIILDNVPYQKCALVMEAATKLGVTLEFLPTYSPNLNLIERVWKFVKSKVLNAAYFETFEVFCKNIQDCTDSLYTKSLPDMTRLVTSKFKIVDSKCVINNERLSA